jgi:hypothetical protein
MTSENSKAKIRILLRKDNRVCCGTLTKGLYIINKNSSRFVRISKRICMKCGKLHKEKVFW